MRGFNTFTNVQKKQENRKSRMTGEVCTSGMVVRLYEIIGVSFLFFFVQVNKSGLIRLFLILSQ